MNNDLTNREYLTKRFYEILEGKSESTIAQLQAASTGESPDKQKRVLERISLLLDAQIDSNAARMIEALNTLIVLQFDSLLELLAESNLALLDSFRK